VFFSFWEDFPHRGRLLGKSTSRFIERYLGEAVCQGGQISILSHWFDHATRESQGILTGFWTVITMGKVRWKLSFPLHRL
jgi:hypothetical protein